MIVIPMAGLSSRFTKVGYQLPKFMLEAHGKTVFEWSVLSFKDYFDSETFVFIILKDKDYESFIKSKLKNLGIKDYYIIEVHPTEGQAHTVYLGLMYIKNHHKIEVNLNSLLIFNIDTFRWNFKLPDPNLIEDGFLEVFEGSGNNWSYVLPLTDSTTEVIMVAEKKPISNLCCSGIYYFSIAKDFIESFEHNMLISVEKIDNKERYVAPLYNYLIKKGKKIHYSLINNNEVIFCGIPQEYEEFLANDIQYIY